MKAKLYGIQRIDFVNSETGEQIQGYKLHVVSSVSEDNPRQMLGNRCASVFTRLDVTALKIGGVIDLVYEQVLGSTKSRLVAVNNC